MRESTTFAKAHAISEWVSCTPVTCSQIVAFSHSHKPPHPILYLNIQPPTTNDKRKEQMRPLFLVCGIYTPANVCPTISDPHIAPLSCSLWLIQPLNSSMVMLALASFHSMLPGR